MAVVETITEILQQNALVSIALISIAVALTSTLVYKYFTDQGLIKQVRDDIKKYQDQIKAHKGDQEKVMELHKKVTDLNMQIMPQQFKPMLITIIPFLIIFWILSTVFGQLVLIPTGTFHVPLSSHETGLGWVGTYVIFSMIFTTIFRKALKVA
ncbi:MAG: DUF106 domain-containing protein [DPANN group archaeon]|nr:DUF106 domain-containing protein [DPANN group archaeon]